MKKLIALLMVAIMALAFVACSDDDEKNDTASATKVTSIA